MWYLYILTCKDSTLYTGITTDLKRRLKEHNTRKETRYTRSRIPVKLVYKEAYLTRSKALKRESQIKSWSKLKKLALVNHNLEQLRNISKSRD